MSDFFISALRCTGYHKTYDDTEDGPSDDVGYVVEAEVDSAEGDKHGPHEQRDTELSVIGRERSGEGKGVCGVTTWKRGLGFWWYAQIARPWACNGVFQSERENIRYYEDEREYERFFAGTGEIERDRDEHHEGDAARERDPPK